jgi:acyl carrier protein
MHSRIEVKEEIRQFVLEDLAHRKGITEFADDELLIPGVVDSLGIFRLVAFFEEHFRIRIADEEITAENFQSLTVMERFVASHMKKPTPSDF